MTIKNLYFVLALLLSGTVLPAQSTALFEANNVRAVLNSNGAMFTQLNDLQYGEFVPLQPGLPELTLLRASGLWIAGKDPAGNLKGAVQLYNAGGKADFISGVIHPGGFEGSASGLLDKIWPVTCGDVHDLWMDLSLGDFPDNSQVMGWPALGNPYFPDHHLLTLPETVFGLAGFSDEDQNGIYDPWLGGDYPSLDIRGCPTDLLPEEMAWFVFHDTTEHTQSGMDTLHMESANPGVRL